MSMLVKMPGFAKLGDLVEKMRDTYFDNLARGLAVQSGPLDQREIDYKRGFWQGALFATRRLPKVQAREWDKVVSEATEEGEHTV